MKKQIQVALLLGSIACMLLFAACYKSKGVYQSTPQTPAQTVVKYSISSSSGNVTVKYTDKDGKEVTVNNVSHDWTISFTTAVNNQLIKLTVIGADNTVTVEGTIFLNGRQVAQESSSTGTVLVTVVVDRMHAGY